MALRHVLHLHALDLPGEDAGQKHHRIDQIVALFDGDHGFRVAALSWWHESAISAALNADLLILHDLALPEIAGILQARRALGRASVFEIADDPTVLAPWRSRPRSTPFDLENFYYLATLCDAVQVSSPGLAKRFSPLAEKMAVLPNAVNFPRSLPEKPAGFRLGWAGTRSHREDLLPVLPVLHDFIVAHPDAVLALKGDMTMLRELFATFPSGQIEIEPFGSYSDYSHFLSSLHVGLIPLGNTLFNHGRTAVKLIEMVAAGTLPIAQDSPVYQDYADWVPLFCNPSALLGHLKHLYAHPEVYQQQVTTARLALRASHDLDAVRAQHRTCYTEYLAAPGGSLLPPEAATQTRYHQLQTIRQARRAGDLQAAESLLATLLAEKPDFAQARWLWVLLLQERQAASDVLDAAAPLQNCVAYGDLWRLLRSRLCPAERSSLLSGFRSRRWQLMATPLTPGDALSQHRQRLAAHPFDFFALAVLARSSLLTEPERQLIRERLSLFPSSLSGSDQ